MPKRLLSSLGEEELTLRTPDSGVGMEKVQ